MDKLKMHSPNLPERNISKLAALFPNCVTESRDEKGKLKRLIDFDQLRQELSSAIVEGPRERYHLNWPGKREALLTANAPIARTLRPCRGESVDFDTTQNLFIEGDNLDVLKLLQETYLGKVNTICIDPPYNTGNDFIYNDNFTADKERYNIESGLRDEEGNKLIDEEKYKRNLTSNGRFHSDWLSMMYPRLKLARNLLKDDGVIFISIDDNEVHNLRKICDEVFGEDNFISAIIWQKRKGGGNDSRYIATDHEEILIYCKSITSNIKKWRTPYSEEYLKRYREHDEKGRFYWDTLHRGGLQSPIIYNVECPDGTIIKNGTWQVSEKTFLEKKKSGEIRIIEGKDANWTVHHKIYQPEGRVFRSIFNDVTNTDSANELISIFSANKFFENPKPSRLIQTLINIIPDNKDDIILDFFAGSATTAHAVMQLNAEDGGNRKFIMVQLPEKCDEKSEAYKAGYSTIAEIGKERIRRAGKKIKENHESTQIDTNKGKEKAPGLFDENNSCELVSISGSKNLDIGFRVLKIDSSNMADVYYTPDAVEQKSLFLSMDNIKPDRTAEDLLFQVLLDWGVDLSLSVTKEIIAGKDVFFVDGNALAACFVKNGGITEDFVKELAKRKPLRVVFRDAGFKDDSVKINVEQIFELMSPHTDVKTI